MGHSQTNYDASLCGKIPLHNTNAIQSHAVLLVVNVSNFQVIQVSSNVCEWLQIAVEDILNQPLERFVDHACVSNIKDKYRKSSFKQVVPEYITLTKGKQRKTYLAHIHEKERYILIEIDFINEQSDEKLFLNVYKKFQEFAVAINQSQSIHELATSSCQQIKRISGFDKVMIYAFDQKWNGLVVAEAMEAGMETYIGLKFPASDVPKQARDLYLKNPYRLIPDRDYKKVSLVPELNQLTNSLTDLTDVKARSVVDVHLEYLRNMKVQASMSTRIIHNEALWGLIACHHRTPKLLSFEECAVFELISNFFTSKLSSLVNQIRTDESIKLNSLLSEINSKITLSENLPDVFKKFGNEIKTLLRGDGMAVCWEGEIFIEGIAPNEHQVKTLLLWLRSKDIKKVVNITSLPDAYEPAKEFASVGSGLMILPIQPYEGNFILAFKMEAVKTVSWGGNPDDAITFEKDSDQYHPRNSFAIWKETVRHTSNPWSEEELIAAERFRNVVVEHALKRLTTTLEQKVNKRTAELGISTQNLSLALEELQEIMHVTSHDLQEPVRKILLFANELNKAIEPGRQKDYIDKIIKASTRINALINDFVNISKVSGNKIVEKCDLQSIVEGVVKRFGETISEHNIQIVTDRLPSVDAVPEQMDLLFTKVIGNAIKFRNPTAKSEIRIKGGFVRTPSLDDAEDKSGMFVRISITDNGIGFNNKHVDKLFKIFETLHPGQYEGTGSSLAIAKRIVESHGGKIYARGKENEGAVFTIILPVAQ